MLAGASVNGGRGVDSTTALAHATTRLPPTHPDDTVADIIRQLGQGGTVAVPILAAPTVAPGVAMSLPWLLDHMDIDPAFGSGPLSTVIQDLFSLTIYFAFATAIVL